MKGEGNRVEVERLPHLSELAHEGHHHQAVEIASVQDPETGATRSEGVNRFYQPNDIKMFSCWSQKMVQYRYPVPNSSMPVVVPTSFLVFIKIFQYITTSRKISNGKSTVQTCNSESGG